MRFQLWAWPGAAGTPVILPRPVAWQASMGLSEVGALTLTYPVGQPGIDALSADHVDVEVRYWDGAAWVCPAQGRFCTAVRSADPVAQADQPTVKWTLQSFGWLTRRIYQEQTTGLDGNGERAFPGMSVPQVIAQLVAEAKTAGSVPDLTVQNLTSAGPAAPAYRPGKSVADLLADADGEGLAEWLVQPDGSGLGRKLVLYDQAGVDRSTGATPVVVRWGSGQPVDGAPSQIAGQDIIGRVLVAGDLNRFLTLSNPGAPSPHGLLPDYVQAGGLSEVGALQLVAQARLDRGSRPLAQHTRSIKLTGGALPLLHYQLGDRIIAPDEHGQPAAMRLRQITITYGPDGVGGNLVLGDRFYEQSERLERMVKQLSGGAGAIRGSGRPPTPASDDKRTPSPPTGLTVGSVPYLAPDGTAQAIATIGWVNPTTATDGTAMAPAVTELWARQGGAAEFAQLTTVAYPGTSVQRSPMPANTVWQFKVRAVAANGHASAYTAVVEATMARDTTPPNRPAPAALATGLRMVTASWNGKDEAGGAQPADFQRAVLQRSPDAGFSAPATIGTFLSAASVVVDGPLTIGATYYYRVIAYDAAGNASTPSSTTSIMVTGVQGPDLMANSVTANAIAVGALDFKFATGMSLIAATIASSTGTGPRYFMDATNLAFFKNATQTALLWNGSTGTLAIDGSIWTSGTITGATIRAGTSNPTTTFTPTEFRMTDSGGNSLVLFQPSSGRVYLDSGSTSYPRLIVDSANGLSWFKDSATVSFRLNASDGSATFGGSITSAATITGSSIVGADYDSGPTYPRVRISPDLGIRLYTSASTYAFYATMAGNAYFSGTVSASTFSGGSMSGSISNSATIAGGTYSSAYHSSGTLGGMPATGVLYASGSGVFRSSNSSNRVDVYGSIIDFVVGGSSSNGATIQGTSGVGLNIGGNTQIMGAVWLPLVASNTTGSSANTHCDASTGRLYRSTSSVRYKADVRPLSGFRRILDAQPVTWVDPKIPHRGRYVGFTSEALAGLGLESLITRDDAGMPDAVNYDRIAAYLVPIVADLDRRLAAMEAA